MPSHILPSQSFKSARPTGAGRALSNLALATARMTQALLASLRRPARGHHRLSLVEEANELRNFASAYQRSDPGFAADLMAAADRHEVQGEKA